MDLFSKADTSTMSPEVLFGETMNGTIHSELREYKKAPADVVSQRLGLLDGKTRYSYSIWRLPENVSFAEVNLRNWPKDYIQTAGAKDGLIVEIRTKIEGRSVQMVVGRRLVAGSDDPLCSIQWDVFTTQVHSSEVFGLEEVEQLFVEYMKHGGVRSESYKLRALEGV